MAETYTKAWFDENKTNLEKIYFCNDIKIRGIPIPEVNRTLEEVEDIAEQKEKRGEIDIWVIAWKMGRVKNPDEAIIINEYIRNGYIRNGYGKKVTGLEDYLNSLCLEDICDKIKHGNLNDAFIKLCKKSPNNFGTVHLINLMHFISKGKVPIYDRFAHIAAKALYVEVNPNKIYVGDPPKKEKTDAAMNMLSEYMWLLKKLFCYSAIDRLTDRALWVYGHANQNFKGVIEYE